VKIPRPFGGFYYVENAYEISESQALQLRYEVSRQYTAIIIYFCQL
jgi:hypothetical protein